MQPGAAHGAACPPRRSGCSGAGLRGLVCLSPGRPCPLWPGRVDRPGTERLPGGRDLARPPDPAVSQPGHAPLIYAQDHHQPAGVRMRAVVFEELGGPDVLKVVEVPDPEPGPGELSIDVAYAGVGFGDVKAR